MGYVCWFFSEAALFAASLVVELCRVLNSVYMLFSSWKMKHLLRIHTIYINVVCAIVLTSI